MAYRSNHRFTTKQRRYLKIKRVLDVILALIMIIPASIITLIFIVWIKLESKGPAIFKQRRPGYHQKIFTMYKLRSMRVETRDKKGRALSDQERMTVSGNIARKTSVDELPQLINILKGEMSFIGPRPFLINDLGTYNKEQLVRFEVLPGITSWTAIHGRNNQTIQDKYNQEIYYVNNISLKLDLYIFFKTIALVFSQKDVEDHTNEGRKAAEIIEDK
ncbi:Sugar transferase involved in LPS biosynthesis (colanic, teichoic acid) [Ruminococcaceae bacterium FB2012]|nr:Sugar transferase involved in LPS biosynthesis (colanic, teichoic acid) [Ruminococcaceae bacterium FB2012]